MCMFYNHIFGEKRETGEKIRSAGFSYIIMCICLTEENGVKANENKQQGKTIGKTKTKYTR